MEVIHFLRRVSATKKILKPCRETGKCLRKVYEEVRLLKLSKYFEQIIEQLLNWAFL